MPNVALNRDKLFAALNQTFTDAEFDELCFQFGIELDEVTTEKAVAKREKGDAAVEEPGNDDVIYKIDVPANRYDILCLEGLSRALNVFRRKAEPPKFAVKPAVPGTRMHVKAETGRIRPFVVCAVLRNIKFDETSYNSFIELQEKLHQNICRKRTLVAIGTHDLDTLEGPFTYEALPPPEIRFKPLNKETEVDGNGVMELYKNDAKMKQYLPIISHSPVFPVIFDAKRRVLSLPPIINGDHSKISLDTKNVFIECTATDLTKAHVVLNVIIAAFSQYCAVPFEVEAVDITYSDGRTARTPDLSSRTLDCDVSYITDGIGVTLPAQQIADCLYRMQLPTEVLDGGHKLRVTVPPVRADVLHACDVLEDVAIAYGYDNIPESLPETVTIGRQQPLGQLTDLLRYEMAMCGYTEVLTFGLCSHDDNWNSIKRVDDGQTAVVLSNPKTADFQECRTNLLQGLLKTLQCNRGAALPISIFEISDIVRLDQSNSVGAHNRRQLSAIYTNTNYSGFEVIHGLLDRLMLVLNVPRASGPNALDGYSIAPSKDGAYFPGRRASVMYKGKCIGVLGVIHPDVVKAFELTFPASAIELDIEPFL
eukprot:tig00021464_g21740.t1